MLKSIEIRSQKLINFAVSKIVHLKTVSLLYSKNYILMKRVALYMRVSTKQQKIVSQRDALLKYVENGGYTITEEYIDEGISGSKKDRPQLVQLIKDAHLHKFDIVLVWKFDRFARSITHLLQSLEEFKYLGIGFVSITDGIDTNSPQGKLLFTMIGILTELERDLIKDRVKAGMQSAKKRGVILGRPGTSPEKIQAIQDLAKGTKLSINAIHEAVGTSDISRAVVGKLVKQQRDKKSNN